MRSQSIRFSPQVWEVVSKEAAATGVTTAQFIREAALARAFYTIGLRAAKAEKPDGPNQIAMEAIRAAQEALGRDDAEEDAADPRRAFAIATDLGRA